MSQFKDDIKNRLYLNKNLWTKDAKMHPRVRSALLAMAREFRDYIGVEEVNVQDVTISGSNAGYNYTKYSDIDLHLVVDLRENTEVMRELFDAKRILYNTVRNQHIGGIKVEFYVETSSETSPVSSGIFSVIKNEWLKFPRRNSGSYDEGAVKAKVDLFTKRIKYAMRTDEYELVSHIWEDLKRMRKSGLEYGGEMSSENLAYKVLRNRGEVTKLLNRINEIRDKELSLEKVTEDEAYELDDLFV